MRFCNLPFCRGRKISTPDGDDFDCDARNPPFCCENCLVLYHETGGLIYPESGRKCPRWLAWLLFWLDEEKR